MTLRSLLLRLLLPAKPKDPDGYKAPAVGFTGLKDIRPVVRQAVQNVAREKFTSLTLGWRPGVSFPPEDEGVATAIFFCICTLRQYHGYSRDQIDAAVIEMLEHIQ